MVEKEENLIKKMELLLIELNTPPYLFVHDKKTRSLEKLDLSDIQDFFYDDRVIQYAIEILEARPKANFRRFHWTYRIWCPPSLRQLGHVLRRSNRFKFPTTWNPDWIIDEGLSPYWIHDEGLSPVSNVVKFAQSVWRHNMDLLLDLEDSQANTNNPMDPMAHIAPLSELLAPYTEHDDDGKKFLSQYSPHVFRKPNQNLCKLFSKSFRSKAVNTIGLARSLMNECSDVWKECGPLFVQLIAFAPIQWWDNPLDPCETVETWRNDITLPQWRCSAICANRRQCPRFSQMDHAFCKFHGATKHEFYLRVPTKRSKPIDAAASEYGDVLNPKLTRYPLTRRVASEMTLALHPHSAPPMDFYLPVLRYEALYYDKSKKPKRAYCGKFFFYEPHSHMHLALGRFRCFGSKVQAFVTLLKESGKTSTIPLPSPPKLDLTQMESLNFNRHKDIVQLATVIFDSPNLRQYVPVQRCPHFYSVETADRFIKARYYSFLLSAADVPDYKQTIMPVLFPSDNPGHANVEPAEFDWLDQPICNMAVEQGIDTILVQHEIGGRDCVTEILDVRKDSVNHLYELSGIVQQRPPKEKDPYPKIWFPHDDGIVYVGPNPTMKSVEYSIQCATLHLTPAQFQVC